jgi:hypothetical protein
MENNLKVVFSKGGATIYTLDIAKPVPAFGAISCAYRLSNPEKILLTDTMQLDREAGVLSSVRQVLERLPL